MKKLVVIGMHLDTDYPSFAEALSEPFDVHVFDFLELGHTIDALTGREIVAVIARIEYFEMIAAVMAVLDPTGIRVNHCLGWDHSHVGCESMDMSHIGLCGCLDMSLPLDVLVTRVADLGTACPKHPETLLLSNLTPNDPVSTPIGNPQAGIDSTMSTLVAHGFTDQQIARTMYYSRQTVRNRISRMLKDQHLDNRTGLATSHLNSSFQTYLSKHDHDPAA